MKKRFFIFFTLLSLNFFCLSLNLTLAYPKTQWGFAFSHINGAGISYVNQLDPYSAITINGIGFYKGDEPPYKMQTFANIGFGYQYTFLKNDLGRLFINPAISYWYLDDKNYTDVIQSDKKLRITDNKINRLWNFGVGVGYEFSLNENFALTTNLEFLIQNSKVSDNNSFIDRNPSGTYFRGLGGGLFIHYKF